MLPAIIKDLAKYHQQFESSGESWYSFKSKTVAEQLLIQALFRGTDDSSKIIKAVLRTINKGLQDNDPDAGKVSQLFDLLLQDGSLDKAIIKAFNNEHMLDSLKRRSLRDGLDDSLCCYDIKQNSRKPLSGHYIFYYKSQESTIYVQSPETFKFQ